MPNGDINWIAGFIWNIADDVVRDVYVRGKYRDVILPMTVIRRLDCNRLNRAGGGGLCNGWMQEGLVPNLPRPLEAAETELPDDGEDIEDETTSEDDGPIDEEAEPKD
jgi:hypothetical protein